MSVVCFSSTWLTKRFGFFEVQLAFSRSGRNRSSQHYGRRVPLPSPGWNSWLPFVPSVRVPTSMLPRIADLPSYSLGGEKGKRKRKKKKTRIQTVPTRVGLPLASGFRVESSLVIGFRPNGHQENASPRPPAAGKQSTGVDHRQFFHR